jgi:glutamate-1-semialdehyde 2,1-aminomutase
VLRYNDVDGLEAAFDQHGDRIAGMILEPVVGNMGCVPATAEFVAAARRVTQRTGALLIYDEVMTGFRVAYEGAQSLHGVRPDLTTLGKIVGGGLPVGAYGGRADVMDCVLPAGRVFQAGTLSGNPLATAAGIATLTQLRQSPPYADLERRSARLESGLRQAAEACGIPHQLARVGSMMTLFFVDRPVRSWDEAQLCDTSRFARFFWGLMDQGVYWPCSQYEALFVSAAHEDEHIEATIAAAAPALRSI